MNSILIIIFTFFSIYYFYKILFFIYGLVQLKENNIGAYSEPVSIIIAVYNGENSLTRILTQLSNQDYKNKIEFIIVDDMSNDKTKEIITNYSKRDNRFIYTSSINGNPTLSYKKKALDAGIRKSKYNILLFTDVDCQVGPKWVYSMVSPFKDNNIEYVVGFSYVDNKSVSNFISKFQQVDFFMLMITAFSCLKSGVPWACSGQNQAYKKELFYRVDGFKKIENCLQGDDTLFMQICNNISNISFCFNPNSYVITRTEYKLISFIKQRIRWAGDANIMWMFNKNLFYMILSTFIINFFIIILGFFISIKLILIFLLIKIILEYLLFIIGKIKFNLNINILHYLIWSIFQIPYIFTIGICSFFTNYLITWKPK